MRHPILWLRARPRVTDASIAVIIAALALVSHLTVHAANGETYARPTVWSVLLCLVATLPVVWRRQRPVVVLNVVVLAQIGLELMDTNGPGWSGVLVAAYSLGAYYERRRIVTVAAGFVAEVSLFAAGEALWGNRSWPDVIAAVALLVAAIALGDNVAMRRRRLADLAERAERAERERGLLAAQHVQEERTRIARELHDAVAHSVSVMVIQAGAARRQLASDPARAEQALLAIEATGREAMVEMRRILGVLRQADDGPDRVPAPSLAMLPELVAADPDLPVQLHVTGDFGDVPSSVEVNVYRLVQEALTNVRRHAGRVDAVHVNVTRSPEAIDVEVVDDGRGAVAATVGGADQAAGAGGHGLVGMRERVAASGGELSAGPRPGGGWRVRAAFPVGAR